MGFTDAFTGFFKKDKAMPSLQVTNVDTAAELGKGAAYNTSQTAAHEAGAQAIDAQEKARFDALFGSANAGMEQRNFDLSNQFANQGYSAAMDTGLQSAMRQFTGAAAQGVAGTGLWGRGAGLPISTASNRVANQIGAGQQYGIGLNEQLLGVQQNRAFSFENAANFLWQRNMVDPNTFLQEANWNTTRKDETTNQNSMIDWQNSKRKSLFEQGIQRSMGSALDLATNPQTQIGVVTSMCGSGAQPQTYPGANGTQGQQQFMPMTGGSGNFGSYNTSMNSSYGSPFSSQGFANGVGAGGGFSNFSSAPSSAPSAFSSEGFAQGIGAGGASGFSGGGGFAGL